MVEQGTDVAIVGAGLSGLALARKLVLSGLSVQVLEARERPGGRILGPRTGTGDPLPYDLGPAWVWPHNIALLRLLQDLNLSTFEQYADGKLVFEDPQGTVRRDLDLAPMAGSLRISGGIETLTRALTASLPEGTVSVGRTVAQINWASDHKAISGNGPHGAFEARARHVVLALPPRVLARDITFAPALSADLIAAFERIPTWMAGHAKLIAIYDTPFWRDMGLSGDAISHRGPLAEIHDASPADDSAGAVFGFFGTSVAARRTAGDALVPATLDQLRRLFGEAASTPRQVLLQDWANEPLTATSADHTPPSAHPDYRRAKGLDDLSAHGLHFAGTELSPHEGGFLEGAVGAADHVSTRIIP
ncbi:MAG: flavin monoamine oxidase family protein [Paracoccaceae bacterium]